MFSMFYYVLGYTYHLTLHFLKPGILFDFHLMIFHYIYILRVTSLTIQSIRKVFVLFSDIYKCHIKIMTCNEPYSVQV